MKNPARTPAVLALIQLFLLCEPRALSSSSMIHTCPHCGKAISPDTEICPHCGADTKKPAQRIRCRYCHRRASANLTVCPHCGRRLEAWRPDRLLAALGILILLALWLGTGKGWATVNKAGAQLVALLPPRATLPPAATSTPWPTSTPTATSIPPTPFPTLPPSATPTASPTPAPSATPTASPTATPEVTVYIVKPGDTAISIALRYDISLNDLLAFNNIDNADAIRVDQELRIPVPSPTATITPTPAATATPTVGAASTQTSTTASPTPTVEGTASPTPTPTATSEPGTYVVQPGDTLIAIAGQWNVSVQALMIYNNIDDAGSLRVGQKLRIPPADYVPPTTTPRPPAATPTPQPTPTPAISLSPPQLQDPADNAAYNGNNAIIILQWRNPEGLPAGIENIVYIGIITGREENDIDWLLSEAVGTASQYQVPAWLFAQAPVEFGRGYVWYVQAAAVSHNGDETTIGSSVSPPSARRRFYWN